MKIKPVIYIILLLAFALFIQRNYLHIHKVTINDLVTVEYITLEFTKKTVLEYHQFPFWADFHMGGMPFFAHPQTFPLYFSTLLFIIIPKINIMFFLNSLIILTTFIAGLFMYFLIMKLKGDENLAFLGAIMFMGSGIIQTYSYVWIYRANTIIWLPLIFLFLYKSFKEKELIRNSIITSMFLFFSFLSAGTDVFLYLIVLFAVFFVVFSVGKNVFGRVTKLIIIYTIILVLFLALASIKLLPLLEFNESSSKNINFNYEDYVGHHIDSFKTLMDQIFISGYTKIGIVVFLLASISLLNIKKRINLFFVILAVVILLIASGTSINYFLWKYIPGFGKMHHVDRALFLFNFSMAFLAVDGAAILFSKIKKKNYQIIYIAIIVLLVIELAILGSKNVYVPKNFEKQMDSNELWKYISEDKDIFRIQNINTNTIGGRASDYALYYNQQILYGQTALWIPEYFNVYLGITHSSPAKFYGMLNTKYIYSENEINVSGLKFIKKFNKCEICDEDYPADRGISGPYLYLNELYLPRAYLANYSILVVGNKDSIVQAMYWILLNPRLDPSNTVVIAKEGTIDQFDLETLKKYTVVFLTQDSISQNSGYLLKSYLDSGGILLPNILNGSTNISAEEIENLLYSFKGDYENVEETSYAYYSPNKQILNISGKKGFVVISEKYFMFEGWKAKLDGKAADIWRANGINSAVYVDGSEYKLELYYSSKIFLMGLFITGIAALFIVSYFSYEYLKNINMKKKST